MCIRTAISGGVDIFEVPFSGVICFNRIVLSEGCKNYFKGLVSHELTAYLSIFDQFKLNELWLYYQKHLNQIIFNHTTLQSLAFRIFEGFIQILLIMDLSCTAGLSNSLPIECFPLTYDLSGFKSITDRHLLTVGSF